MEPTDTEEEPVTFNINHHVGGLNAKFFEDRETLRKRFADEGGIFENPMREILVHSKKIFDRMAERIPSKSLVGARILDLGAGTGILESHLSPIVGPEGVIFANDLSPGFVGLVSELADSGKLAHRNVIPVIGTEKSVQQGELGARVPLCSLDVAFMCDVYHHLEFPRTMMRDIKRYLKIGTGRVFVIDFYRDPSRMVSHSPEWALDHLRADKADFIREIESAGFVLEDDDDFEELRENYMLCFRAA